MSCTESTYVPENRANVFYIRLWKHSGSITVSVELPPGTFFFAVSDEYREMDAIMPCESSLTVHYVYVRISLIKFRRTMLASLVWSEDKKLFYTIETLLYAVMSPIKLCVKTIF